jgi:hypothetical protein
MKATKWCHQKRRRAKQQLDPSIAHPDRVRMGNRLSSKQHGNNTDLNPKLLFLALLNLKRKAPITDAKSPHLNSHQYSSYSH